MQHYEQTCSVYLHRCTRHIQIFLCLVSQEKKALWIIVTTTAIVLKLIQYQPIGRV